MNTRHYVTIGGASFAAVMAMSLLFTPVLAAGSYTLVKTFEVLSNPASDSVQYRVTTTAPIPQQENEYINSLPITVLGYGWVDFDTVGSDGYVTGVFATIHPAFTDSTFSTGDEWHAHTGRVAPSATNENMLCLVHLESPAFSLRNSGATLSQTLASADATVGPADVDGAASFTLKLDVDENGDPLGNCPTIEVPVLSETAGMLPIEVILPAP